MITCGRQPVHFTMDDLEGSKQPGRFAVSPGREVLGELTLLGPKTSLYLHDKDEFSTQAIPNQYIKGILHDLTKISLIKCVTMSGPGYADRGADKYHFSTVFPHFVAYGDSHIEPDEKKISKVHFATDDLTTLFYDFDAFGFLFDAHPFIETIANANAYGRNIITGPDPQILYFTGKREIFSADTSLGRVSASHNPRHLYLGGPEGVGLKNTIFVTIEFTQPAAFEESLVPVSVLLRYLEVLVGRPQALLALELEIESPNQTSTTLRVYWSMYPKSDPARKEEKPHPSDVLLDGVRQPTEFSRVLANCRAREQAWRDARFRFSSCFANQNRYTIERLIETANMFDILPPTAVPSDVPVSRELEAAGESSREAFLRLPISPERDSVLSALGRIGKASLKRKIRHRAGIILARLRERFPELYTVTDQAVDCRNHYVHGGPPKFDYNANFHAVTFFTDTLEFVFAASDLVEAGWDIKTWNAVGTVMSHPFSRLRVNYANHLNELKALLAP
jgi:ApeA N-terminal domain 1/Apea-like HEPN